MFMHKMKALIAHQAYQSLGNDQEDDVQGQQDRQSEIDARGHKRGDRQQVFKALCIPDGDQEESRERCQREHEPAGPMPVLVAWP